MRIPKFKIGDQVCLKSGSRVLTVKEYVVTSEINNSYNSHYEGRLRLAWLQDDMINEIEFDEIMLQKSIVSFFSPPANEVIEAAQMVVNQE